MYYKLKVNPMPRTVASYEISRQTIWHCADENNIIVIILDGECCFNISNVSYELSKGDIILIPAGQEYVRKPVNNKACRFAYVHFTLSEPIERISLESYNDLLKVIVKEHYEKSSDISKVVLPQIIKSCVDFDDIEIILNNLLKEDRQSDGMSNYLASLSLLQIILIMQKGILSPYSIKNDSSDTAGSRIVQTAVEYIRRNYENRISLEDLVNITNVSPQHLIRLFRSELNMTPIEYINHVKILHAIEFLRSSNLTVEEISYKLNFTSSSYFGRVFKRYNGNTPMEERIRIKTYRSQNNE